VPLRLPKISVRNFNSALEGAGQSKTVRLYELRHTQVRLLVAEGVHPKVAAERLGHATTRRIEDSLFR
jgi:site-specific recombinase XerD